MNNLYNIAIIEGFLSQYGDLPKAVKDALESVKQEHSSKQEQIVAPSNSNTPVKKKTKVSRERKAMLRIQCAKMREIRLAKIAAAKTAA